MKSLEIVFDFILSIIIGFYINLHITSDLTAYFFSGNYTIYISIFFLTLVIQILFVFSIIRLFRNKSIDLITFKVLIALYSVIILFLLFGRQVMDISINLNPLRILEFNKDNFFQNILNIIFFIPIGYLIKNISKSNAIKYTLLGLILIELLQLITKRGILDINDIILNSLGVFIGYYFCNKYKIDLLQK